MTLDTFVGDAESTRRLPLALAAFDCRTTAPPSSASRRTACGVVAAAARRHGPGRVGAFGTSTAGILQTELADRPRRIGELPADFNYRATHNTLSIASTRARVSPSRARARRSPPRSRAPRRRRRAPDAGVIDAAGGDTLCLTTLRLQLAGVLRASRAAYDAAALASPSARPRPSPLERAPPARPRVDACWRRRMCDAHHMSAPHPEDWARLAMESAPHRPDSTPTPSLREPAWHRHASNDAAEDHAVVGLLGRDAGELGLGHDWHTPRPRASGGADRGAAAGRGAQPGVPARASSIPSRRRATRPRAVRLRSRAS